MSALSIPVIANGDVFEYEDFKRIKDATGLCFYQYCYLSVRAVVNLGSSPLSVNNVVTAFEYAFIATATILQLFPERYDIKH